ncbi:MAG: hypothetical protein U9N34_10030, partial [Candidatus Cloacimonadota bacterium]|nr:hypothetical protein [Candidatus Cloacimonadota bacterium]
GEDFSVKTTDEQGNTTDKFFQTGVIMDVTPTFINDDKSSGIHLVAKVEKSSASPGEVSTVIQKSFTETEVILFDGEETVMAGMYDTEEIQERVGIPILKDLPWWVLGIRYLAGFEKIELKKREMVIVLSAKVLDTVNQRKEKSIKLDETLNESRKENKKIEMIFRQEEKNETAN